MPTKKQLSKNNGLLDKLWRSVGKENAYCEICATLPSHLRINYKKLDPHHIVKRGHKATRWDLRNRIWVCFTHHTGGRQTVEYNEGGWFWGREGDWMGTHRPEDKEHLELKRWEIKKWSVDELEEIYKQLSEYSEGSIR